MLKHSLFKKAFFTKHIFSEILLIKLILSNKSIWWSVFDITFPVFLSDTIRCHYISTVSNLTENLVQTFLQHSLVKLILAVLTFNIIYLLFHFFTYYILVSNTMPKFHILKSPPFPSLRRRIE